MKRGFVIIKRVLCLLVIFTLFISYISALGLTAYAETSGTCGENLTWSLDDEGNLIISGTGDMYNLMYYGSVPWYSNRSKVKTVTITDGVTTISDYAFYNCNSLTSVTIPDSVTTIGNLAFSLCDSLTSVAIPDSVITIGNGAFSRCDSLTSIIVDDNNLSYTTVDGNLFDKSKTEFIQYAIGKTVSTYTIPDSITHIGNQAFYYCDNLTSVIIPDSVTAIGDGAFYRCDSLMNVTMGDSVTAIGEEAFLGCDSLTAVTMGDSVTTIGEWAFSECYNLTSVTMGDSVTTIGEWAFSFCDILTNVTMGDSITTIGNDAFCSCSSLTNVTIPDSVTSIGHEAFSGCFSLTSVTIGSGVTTIGNYAFEDCDNLTDIYYNGIEAEWKNINIGSYNDDLTNANIHYSKVASGVCGENLTWSLDDEGTLIISGTGAMTSWTEASSVPWYSNRNDIKTVTITDGVTTIGGLALYLCKNLTSVTIPDSVITIGESAFEQCNKLKRVIIPDGVTTIGKRAFVSCKSLTNITIPDNVTTIGETVFYSCTNLTSVIIGSSVTTIGERVFSYCYNLTSIIVDDNNPSYISVDGNLFNKPKTKLIQYAVGKTDTHYTIPDSVTTIGDKAFIACDNLTSVTIGSSVTTLEYDAFSMCHNLAIVTIPVSVTTISNCAFEYCKSLTDVYYNGTEVEWNNIKIGWSNDKLINATIHYNSFADSIGDVICSYINGRITADVTFDEITQPGRLYMAVYDGLGSLVSLSATDITVGTKGYTIDSAEVSGSPIVKFFVFDTDLTLSKPIGKAYDYGVFEITQ